MTGSLEDRWTVAARTIAAERGALLALDTSGAVASVALVTETGASESVLDASSRPSEELAPLLLSLLEGQGLSAADLGGVVIGIGPGSFTGLRVGLALAKGMCVGGDLALFAVSSFALIAAGRAPGDIAVVTDNRGGQLFFGRYEVSGDGVHARVADGARRTEDVARALGDSPPTCMVGDAATALAEQAGLDVPIIAEATPRALAGIVLAGDAIRSGRGQSVGALTPAYLRLSEAERAALG